MTKRVSVVIPSRRERFLQPTIDDLCKKAAGPIEIIVVHDGAWPDPPLKDNPLVTSIHWAESRGMRAGINAAVSIARGDYILKLDGHCMVGEGFDEILKEDCPEDAVMVPRRYSLDAENWCSKPDKPPVDAHYLSYPFERPNDPTCGLHGTIWRERAKARKDVLVDEEVSSQGSCYFMHRRYWNHIGPLDDKSYGSFTNEFQEVGLKAWLGGGRVLVTKRTSYSHLHKGKTYGTGYGFTNAQWGHWKKHVQKGQEFTVRYWMLNQWKERVHDLEWLIARFWPMPSWGDDLDAAFSRAHEILKGAK